MTLSRGTIEKEGGEVSASPFPPGTSSVIRDLGDKMPTDPGPLPPGLRRDAGWVGTSVLGL